MKQIFRSSPIGAFLIVMVLSSCAEPELVEEQYFPNESVASYLEAIEGLALDTSSMGQTWIQQVDPQLHPTALVLTPVVEDRYFDPAIPRAAYYLLEGVRGQWVDITIEPDSSMGYFADLFGLPQSFHPDQVAEPWEELEFRPVASGSVEGVLVESQALVGKASLRIEPRDSRFYLLRVIPRLLEGGRVRISINAQASLSWPVMNSDRDDIISVFGASRDWGARVHHGIDIVAPRGTPLITMEDSLRLLRVGERDLGGKAVSMVNERRQLIYYYAHMDEYGDIASGQFMPDGASILGTVGNTGNALGGPYHLHLGIYDNSWRRPLDPWYFLIPLENDYPGPPTVPWQLGEQYRLSTPSLLYGQPRTQSSVEPSPARYHYDGEPITSIDRPIQRRDWGDPWEVETHAPLRLVAIRSNALGFEDPRGSVVWGELSLVLEPVEEG